MSNQAIETKRTLTAHDKLLVDVIKRQAGTLKKAVLEGTMNSVEAGSTGIEIQFLAERSKDPKNPSPAFLSIRDDGLGIPTKEEVILHFETFGQPHEENEHKVYAQFRMGRGQMFAFGRNKWRTSTFQMYVDIDRMGLDYFLTENMPFVSGCNIDIELYKNPLDNYTISSVQSFKEEVKEQVRYVKIPVLFNGEQISVDPSILNWDYEDENAYYLFNDTSSMKYYNLGVFVMSKSIVEDGVGGIVVSKKRLEVNFARNDIQSDCPIYQAIKKIVFENKIKKQTKQYTSLSDHQRINMLTDLRDGSQSFHELRGKRIFKTSQEKWISWNMIVNDSRPWCFTPSGDMSADKAMQMGVALCLDESLPNEMGYSGPLNEFFDWIVSSHMDNKYPPYGLKEELNKLRNLFLMYDGKEKVSARGLPKLRDMFQEDYKYIEYAKMTKSERLIIDTLSHLGRYDGSLWENRRIRLGVSTVASAWTDGSTYIAFDREYLRKMNLRNEGDILKLLTTGCHELAHDENTAGTHQHGPQFYEKFYEIVHRSSYDNPIYFVTQFRKAMDRKKIDDKRQEEEDKIKKAKEKLEGKAVAADTK